MKFRIAAKICSAKLVHHFHSHGYVAYWQQYGVNVTPYGRCLLLPRLGKTAEIKHSFVSDHVKVFPRNKWSNVCFYSDSALCWNHFVLSCPKNLRTVTLATGQWRKLRQTANCSDLGEKSLPRMSDLR